MPTASAHGGITATPLRNVAALSGYRRVGAISVASGGVLIALGWLLPWGSAGSGDVSGLSETLQWWFRAVVLASGFFAIVAGLLAGHTWSAWLIGITTLSVVGWSLILPAVVYVAARAAAGFPDVPANAGPTVTHGIGAYSLAIGVVAVAIGSGPATTGRRIVWIASAAVGALLGLLLVVGLV